MSSENFEQVSRWYVVYTLPNHEQRADSNLRAWHLETFAPKIKARRVNPFNGVSTYVTRPLFPRYIFARFNLNALMHKVCFTRGVSNVVSFGGDPTPVDDAIIEMMQLQVGEDECIEIGETLKYGDRVMIKAGPLKNFFGIFKRNVDQGERVRLLLTAINYQGHLEIEREYLQKVG